jgi:K+ transporter
MATSARARSTPSARRWPPPITDYFQIPTDRVVEIGMQVSV